MMHITNKLYRKAYANITSIAIIYNNVVLVSNFCGMESIPTMIIP